MKEEKGKHFSMSYKDSEWMNKWMNEWMNEFMLVSYQWIEWIMANCRATTPQNRQWARDKNGVRKLRRPEKKGLIAI